MSPELIGILGILLMFVLLALRLYIGIAMAVIGFLGLSAIVGFEAGVNILGLTPMAEGSSYTLSVIPLFVGDMLPKRSVVAQLLRPNAPHNALRLSHQLVELLA